jgi:hypothetical protein
MVFPVLNGNELLLKSSPFDLIFFSVATHNQELTHYFNNYLIPIVYEALQNEVKIRCLSFQGYVI